VYYYYFLRDFSSPVSLTLSLSLSFCVSLPIPLCPPLSTCLFLCAHYPSAYLSPSVAPLLHIICASRACVFIIVVLCIRYDNDYRSVPEGTRARVGPPCDFIFSDFFSSSPHVLDFSYGYKSPTRRRDRDMQWQQLHYSPNILCIL